jgi:hypothetical protein
VSKAWRKKERKKNEAYESRSAVILLRRLLETTMRRRNPPVALAHKVEDDLLVVGLELVEDLDLLLVLFLFGLLEQVLVLALELDRVRLGAGSDVHFLQKGEMEREGGKGQSERKGKRIGRGESGEDGGGR